MSHCLRSGQQGCVYARAKLQCICTMHESNGSMYAFGLRCTVQLVILSPFWSFMQTVFMEQELYNQGSLAKAMAAYLVTVLCLRVI